MDYREARNEIFYLCVVALYLLSLVLELTSVGENIVIFSKLLHYITYVGALTKIIDSYYEDIEFVGIIIIGALIILSAIYCDNKTMIFFFLMIVAAKNIDSYKLVLVGALVQGIVLLVFVGMSQFGIVPNYLFDITGRTRLGLGFTWTTTAPILFFFCVMGYIYLRRERMTLYEYIILEIINYWLYLKTDTRMSFLLLSLVILLFFLFQISGNKLTRLIRKLIGKWLLVVPSLCCIFAIYLHAAYNQYNHILVAVNDKISGRLSLGKNALEKYGISLFGRKIEWIGFNNKGQSTLYNYVDCSYMQILLEYGCIFLLIVILGYTIILYKAVNKKDIYLTIVILCILVFSITEPRLMNLAFNPFPLLIFSDCKLNKRSVNNGIEVEVSKGKLER